MIGYSPAGMIIVKYAHREGLGLSDLAHAMEISYPHMINMLKGLRNIDNEKVQKFTNVLNLNKKEKRELKEAVFISNDKIVIRTRNRKEEILRLIYYIVVNSRNISSKTVDQCFEILKENKPE